MRPLRSAALLCGLLAAAAIGPAAATTPVGPDAARPHERGGVAAAPTAGQAETLELVRATIDAVHAERAELVVRGQAIPWDPARIRVLRDRRSVGVGALQPRQAIRFAYEPGTQQPRRIVLIVVEH